MVTHIPHSAVKRLSLYLRQLEHLRDKGMRKVSSRQLAGSLMITAEQVRKDLTYFGQFGKPGLGYLVAPLAESLRHILGTDTTQKVLVVGAGDLGRALLRHKGFMQKGFEMVAAFDADASKVGQMIGGVPVYHVRQLSRLARHFRARLAVLAVPAEAAQSIVDTLCRAGVRGILNFAPVTLKTPPGVAVTPVDLAASLEELSFKIGAGS
jgi:redox-sensing transcriptional repressor